MFYIDNPVGTGFSFVQNENAYRTNETMVAQDLYQVITTLVKEAYPQFNNSPIFIAGESYAGFIFNLKIYFY